MADTTITVTINAVDRTGRAFAAVESGLNRITAAANGVSQSADALQRLATNADAAAKAMEKANPPTDRLKLAADGADGAAKGLNALASAATLAGRNAEGLRTLATMAEVAGVAVTTLSSAMRVLGGPAGIAVTAVAGIAAWAIGTEEAEGKTYNFSKRLAELQGNMLKVKQMNLQEEFEKTKQEIQEIQDKWRTGPPLFGSREQYEKDQQAIRDGNRLLNGLRHQLDDTRKAINAEGEKKSAAPVAKAPDAAQQAAECITAKAQAPVQDQMPDEQNAAADKFAQLQESLFTEEQAIAQSYANRWAIIQEAEGQHAANDEALNEARLQVQQEYQEQVAALHEQELKTALEHQAALGDAEAQGALKRLEFDKMTSKQKTKSVLGDLLQMTNGVAKQNKALFEINKIAAIADATINAHDAASKAYATYAANPPLAAAMAAIAYAAGAARISAIASTSFGGQGGGGGGGGGGGAAAAPTAQGAATVGSPPDLNGAVAASTAQTQSAPAMNVTFNVQGGLVDERAARESLERLMQTAKDMGMTVALQA